jgi:hypothetical protein
MNTARDDLTTQQLATFIRSYRSSRQLTRPEQPALAAAGQQPIVEELARELVTFAETQGLRLGTWTTTTDGEVVVRAVELALPYPYRQETQLFVAALQLAARMQQRRERSLVLAVATGLAAVLVVSALIRHPR